MAIFQVDIEKQQGAEFWTNVYHVDTSDISAASAAAADIVDIEQTFHTTDVSFTKYRVSTYPVSDGSFIIVPIGESGGKTPGTSQLPLFCVARADISVGLGRPCRKYYRLPLYESDTEGQSITIATRGDVDDGLAAMVALGVLCDPDGQEWVAGSTMIPIAMRQLRRGSKRSAAPVI